MSIASTKIELAKRLLSTEDKDVINYIKAIFDTRNDDWFESLPTEIQQSVERSLSQAKKGELTSHAEAMKRYEKWLKK